MSETSKRDSFLFQPSVTHGKARMKFGKVKRNHEGDISEVSLRQTPHSVLTCFYLANIQQEGLHA